MVDEQGIALVTGASSGLGEEFVRQLAPRCSRIIAVARRTDKLQALADELRDQVEIVALGADLAVLEGQARAVEAIRQRGPLRYLVNNAGFGTFGPFAASDIDRELMMVRLHQDAVLALSRAALPAMCDAGQGYLINVASLGAFLAMNNSAVYGATKAFLNAFSLSLQSEVRRHGVRVQSLCPGLTRTEIHDQPEFADFDKNAMPESLWMESQEVVRASLQALDGDQVVVIPGAMNRAMALAAMDEVRRSIDQQAP